LYKGYHRKAAVTTVPCQASALIIRRLKERWFYKDRTTIIIKISILAPT